MQVGRDRRTGCRRGLDRRGDSHPVASTRPEYANETTFVTGTDALAELRVDTLREDETDAIALSTDGLRYKILDDLATYRPYEPFFEDLFAYAGSDSPAT